MFQFAEAFFWMLCCPVRILVVLEFSAETSERTLEERLCVGWNSRIARSLLVSSVEKANVSTSMTLQLNLFRVCGQRGVPKMTVSPFP